MKSAIRTQTPHPACGRRRPFARALGALALLLAGCAAPAVVHYYTLMPAERPAPRGGAMPAAGAGPVFALESVDVPTQVDQPQWLVRLPDDTLALLEQERWASPLRDEIGQALAEILTRRFGAVEMRAAAADAPAWRIRVAVTRFETLPGEARLAVTWLLTPRRPESAALRCVAEWRENAAAGMAALAEAHRRALARFGDALGEQLLALQRGEKGSCPP